MRSFAYPIALAAALAAAPAVAQPFSGFHVDAIVGYDYNHNQNGTDGLLYGGGAGYDFRLGRFVAGVDSEVSDTTAKGCFDQAFGVDRVGCSRGERDLYAGARIGAVIAPRVLLYAKAGYTNDLRHHTVYEAGEQILRESNDFDGGRVGAGLEFALAPHTFVKTEYRYSNYEAGLIRHQAVVGAGFRF